MRVVSHIVIVLLILACGKVLAQNGKLVIIPTDSTTEVKNPAFTKDTSITIVKKDTIKTASKHNPGTATLRSLIIPGWGQAYNREYWKIPIVYGAIGTVGAIFLYNNTWYKRTRDAYNIKVNHPNDPDTANIYPRLKVYSASNLQNLRNSFRRDRDYSVLYFLLFWGLNVADATVFAHLKEFDVSEDLSLKIDPVIRTNGSAGISLVLGFKPPAKNHIYFTK